MKKNYVVIFLIIAFGVITLFSVINSENKKIISQTKMVIKDSECSNTIKNKSDYSSKKIAITFDDGPNGRYTERLLDELKKRDIKATFFVVGKNIKQNEEIIIRMVNEGHLVGNHTYSHADLAKLKFKEACDEINTTNAYIYNLTGYTPKFIRPPYGSFSNKLLEETNMSVVLWSIDPLDWKNQNSTVVSARIMKNVKEGDIILLHDIYKTSVEAAINVIDKLIKDDYTFVTVDKLEDNSNIIWQNTNK